MFIKKEFISQQALKKALASFFVLLVFASNGQDQAPSSQWVPEIYSQHWFGPLPLLSSDHNKPLLFHDIFVILFDPEKRFPVYLAYRLNPHLIWGELKTERKYIQDPLLPSPSMGLSANDYKGASRCDGRGRGYDRGHLAPRSAFKGTEFASQAQYLTNIVPQRRDLNQGPWQKLDILIHNFVKDGNEVRIMTGPLYGQVGETKTPPCWRAAQGKITEIPTGYWKIISRKQARRKEVCSFLIPQTTRRKTKPDSYIVPLTHIEEKIGRDLLHETTIVETCQFLIP